MDPAIKQKLLQQAKQYSYLHLDNILAIENAFIAGGELAFSSFLLSDSKIPAQTYASKQDYDTLEEFKAIRNSFKAGFDFILKNN